MSSVIVNQQTACTLDVTRKELKALRATIAISETHHPSAPGAYVLTYEHVNPENGHASTRRIYVKDARTVTAQDARAMLQAPPSKLRTLVRALGRIVKVAKS